jgi:hypothetical protein
LFLITSQIYVNSYINSISHHTQIISSLSHSISHLKHCDCPAGSLAGRTKAQPAGAQLPRWGHPSAPRGAGHAPNVPTSGSGGGPRQAAAPARERQVAHPHPFDLSVLQLVKDSKSFLGRTALPKILSYDENKGFV